MKNRRVQILRYVLLTCYRRYFRGSRWDYMVSITLARHSVWVFTAQLSQRTGLQFWILSWLLLFRLWKQRKGPVSRWPSPPRGEGNYWKWNATRDVLNSIYRFVLWFEEAKEQFPTKMRRNGAFLWSVKPGWRAATHYWKNPKIILSFALVFDNRNTKKFILTRNIKFLKTWIALCFWQK